MKLVTPVVTLSFPHLDKPQPAKKPTDTPKHSAALVFENRAALEPVYQAAVAVAIEKWGPTKGPKMVTIGGKMSTFRNDVEDKYPDGSIYISARNEEKPGLVYRHAGPDGKKPALVEDKDIRTVFYPGAQVKASITPFAYDHPENKGIGFALNHLQKWADGERLDGRAAPEDTFEADLSQAPAELKALIGG